MKDFKYLSILLGLGLIVHKINGCILNDLNNVFMPLDLTILDTDRDEIYRGNTTGIQGIVSADHSGEVPINRGPYFEVDHQDSQFILRLNDNFREYEEYETSQVMSLRVVFSCATITSSYNLLIFISITDTNNNSPRFLPTDSFELTITPPLSPGYQLTGCGYDIIARDIDLTNYAIVFGIEDNDYFEISYANVDSNDQKNHHAMLRTKAFLRSLAEPLTLQISATDVDNTGNPPRTTYTTITLVSDDRFQLPDEPQFNEAFFLATYTWDHNVIVDETISLQQGFDAEVQFGLRGVYADYFQVVPDSTGTLTLQVRDQLPASVIDEETHIYLIITADRELTSGTSATVIVKLPEPRILSFDEEIYRGTIEDDVLNLGTIALNVGYQDDVLFSLSGDYSNMFDVSNVGNLVTINLQRPLAEDIVLENNFLILTLEASGLNAVSARVTVILDIIREEEVLPLFSQNIYSGTLNDTSLHVETIYLAQGYDDTITFNLEGAHSEWFVAQSLGNSVTIALRSQIPDEVLDENTFFAFTIKATRDSVEAHASITISIVDDSVVKVLRFEQITYTGSIEQNAIILDAILLNERYSNEVEFRLLGEWSSYFVLNDNGQTLTLEMRGPLPQDVLFENNFLILEIHANAPESISGYTVIVLKLEEILSPAFSRPYYTGQYNETGGLFIEQQITVQNNDEDVTLSLEGDHAQWFTFEQTESIVAISLRDSIPEEVMDSQKFLTFTIRATRRNLNAESTIIISFLKDDAIDVLRFERISYLGSIEDNQVILDPIILNEGYSNDVEFSLQGDLSSYFTLSVTDRLITLVKEETIPEEIMNENEFAVLELYAEAPESVSGYATIILQWPNIIAPQFNQPYFIIEYNVTEGLILDNEIILEGYDETATISLDGEHSQWFSFQISGNVLVIQLSEAIPDEILQDKLFVTFTIKASRGSSESESTIIVSLHKDPPVLNVLKFEQINYIGTLENNIVDMDHITLVEGYANENVQFTLYGDLATHFTINIDEGRLTLQNEIPIPEESLNEVPFVVLELHATAPDAVSGYTVIILEIKRLPRTDLEFNQLFYVGQYDSTDGLSFDMTINLQQGYEDSVTFELEGDHSQWFGIHNLGNEVIISLNNDIPADVLTNNHVLVFTIKAQLDTLSTKAVVIVSLLNDLPSVDILRFERISYEGSVEDELVILDPIVLTEGYRDDVVFSLDGDLSQYFELYITDRIVTLSKIRTIPEEILNGLNVIVLELQATAPETISGYATIVLRLTHETIVDLPSFSQVYYTGRYGTTDGLSIDTPIYLQRGYDDSVTFELEGVHSQWFTMQANENIVTISLNGALPTEVLANNRFLVFTVTALQETRKAEATIIISITDDFSSAEIMRFERINYQGSIEDEAVHLDPIVLSEGYREDVVFTLHGDLSSYFQLFVTDRVVTLSKSSVIPDDVLNEMNVVVLELHATAPETITGYTTIVLSLSHTTSVNVPTFSQAYYTGRYATSDGLTMDAQIYLQRGYDESVTFELEGVHSQWFTMQANENIVTISLNGALPTEVLANNRFLVFTVTALQETRKAEATIIISITDDFSSAEIMRFERINYQGSIEDEAVHLDPIVLSEGYREDVVFTLHGDLSSYFQLVVTDRVVTLSKSSVIPDDVLNEMNVVVLELHATAPETVTGYTTIVLSLSHTTSVNVPTFSQAYYTGRYATSDGLTMDAQIYLQQGYDESVTFELEGVHSQWFTMQANENIVTISLNGALPTEVLANNRFLVFTVTALQETRKAEATIIISITDDFSSAEIMRFERINYQGSIEDETVHLDPIVLSEGYREDVVFTVHGDLSSYFQLVVTDRVVTLSKSSVIPDDVLNEMNVVVLELHATAPETVTGYTTIVLSLSHTTSVNVPTFSQTYYTGRYATSDGLTMDAQIYLQQGYDESVTFELEGVHSQWFTMQANENIVTISLNGALPTEVLANNRFLVFTVTALQETRKAEATIIISITDDFSSAEIMRFERINYQGSIEDEAVHLDPIVLSEGYREDVVFTLHGDLSSYFQLVVTDRVVTLSKSSVIPDDVLNKMNVVVLELHATAPETVTGYTTIVLSLSHTTSVNVPTFSQAYYTGRYATSDGLTMDAQIYLQQGYDESVTFELEGVHSQWFTMQANENIVTISLNGALPTEVLANNRFLVFTVTALQETRKAEATIIISITDDFSSAEIMRFERINYQGSIEDEAVHLDPIVLSKGYREDVVFTLHGDLSSYFQLFVTDRVVTLSKSSVIPDDVLNDMNVVVLELHATAPETVTGYTTIVLSLSHKTSVNVPTFSQAYYTGRYATSDGLTMDAQIYLQQGYDESVTFELEGVHSQWFTMQANENIVTISLNGALPTEVLANNRFLVFTVTALQETRKAEATIIISITDDFSSAEIMRFKRINYQGSIEDEAVHLDPIVLSEGYREDVVFTLHGDLSSYFQLFVTDRVVTLSKSSVIPDDVLNDMNVVVLELHATAPETVTGYTTIVLSLSHTTSVNVPTFSQAYYTGRYATSDGLTMDAQIYLQQGYDESVTFELEGVHSQWFTMQANENIVTISLNGALPTEVLANNRFLVFTVTALQETRKAETTIIISITDDFSSAEIMRFERINYQGSIEDEAVHLDPIVLSEGYREDVVFTLHGDLSSYFQLFVTDRVVTLWKSSVIPDDVLNEMNVVVLELHATAPETVTGYTTIVLSLSHSTSVNVPTFSQAYYTGRYATSDGLTMDAQIYLQQGYDESVTFELEGVHSQWFTMQANENIVTISLNGALPTEVLANNRFLVFTVTALQETRKAEATIIISITDDFSSAEIMRFERINYQGSIEDEAVHLDPIVLSEGYREDVVFTLHGDLSSYFQLFVTDRVVTLSKSSVIPDDVLNDMNVVVLELHATAPETVTGYTTIVLSLSHKTSVNVPTFSQAYYTGRYATSDGLTMDAQIYLQQGYDESVTFELEGVHSQWFTMQANENIVTISLNGALPTEVLANNRFLVFTVTALQETRKAEATIIISITDDFSSAEIMRFERINYQGSIEDEAVHLDPIVLSEGYREDVVFTLHGDLSSYFQLVVTDRVVTLSKSSVIPDDVLNEMNVVVLELHATAPETVTGYTTIVLSLSHTTSVNVPTFSQAYYTGRYATSDGFTMDAQIYLQQGYDESVTFELEGVHSQWFTMQANENIVTISLNGALPTEVLANSRFLVFTVTALQETRKAEATIIISITDDFSSAEIMRFERINYQGSIEDEAVHLDPIVLSEGYREDVVFTLHGDLSSYFQLLVTDRVVTLSKSSVIPDDVLNEINVVVLELHATAPETVTGYTTIVLSLSHTTSVNVPTFSQAYYTGRYATSDGLTMDAQIYLQQGYDESVTFELEGVHSQWFTMQANENIVTISLNGALPTEVLANNRFLVFTVTALQETRKAETTIIISITDDFSSAEIMRFERINYQGSIEDEAVHLDPIVLSEGYREDVVFTLHGDLSSYFQLFVTDRVVTLWKSSVIPDDVLNEMNVVVLELHATAPETVTGYTTIVLSLSHSTSVNVPTFSQAYYTGRYATSDGLTMDAQIYLQQGYDESVTFELEGVHSQWFTMQANENIVTISLNGALPTEVLANNRFLVFTVTALQETRKAEATIIISITDDFSSAEIMRFERINYQGSIEDEAVHLDPIVLSEGYREDVVFTLHGDLSSYFQLFVTDRVVTLWKSSVIPDDVLNEMNVVVLELHATAPETVTGYTTIVLSLRHTTSVNLPTFSQAYYTGRYGTSDGLTMDYDIYLQQGYDGLLTLELVGEQSQWFYVEVVDDNRNIMIFLNTPIPNDVLLNNHFITFTLRALVEDMPSFATETAIIIRFLSESVSEDQPYFSGALFEGIFELGAVRHDPITVTNHDGSELQIVGVYSSSFEGSITDGVVLVSAREDASIPPDVSFVALELRASSARAALVLSVSHPTSTPPTVEFSSASYAVKIDVTQVGPVGRVSASADNGETLTYTLQIDDDHLAERISINNDGDLHVSAPVDSGVYSFVVTATTVATQVSATATVHFTVDSVITCDDRTAVRPLVILDRDEEEPHENLLTIDQDPLNRCWYVLTNKWPLQQNWLYVDERGLHAREIDREDPSIAFMALSQIQVQLDLECEGGDTSFRRSKRSTDIQVKHDWLGPYDYGTSKWILTDEIAYNPRRSFVNLIVNDINDNAPIFVGKENEPIVLGYPIAEILDAVMPVHLALVKATDADVGENAAIAYWSNNTLVAVARESGSVHIRDNAADAIEDGTTVTIYATDRAGAPDGLTGSINLQIQHLDLRHIAVVTVRNAFLDDEATILRAISDELGYEVKSLRSIVISDDYEMINESSDDRVKNVRSARQEGSDGASLQLYMYGLIEREPVEANQLISDLDDVASTILVGSRIPLEQHIQEQEPCHYSNGPLIGLIIVSVLLFVLLLAVAAWFFMKWWKKRNYEKFSDRDSLTSKPESIHSEMPTLETTTRPRPNIEEIKRSEKRLQEILNAPIPAQQTSRSQPTSATPEVAKIDLPPPDTTIVIQSIDKLKDDPEGSGSEDEYGERKTRTRRKSVVTFNENVEKIIHVEDTPEDENVEVYRL